MVLPSLKLFLRTVNLTSYFNSKQIFMESYRMIPVTVIITLIKEYVCLLYLSTSMYMLWNQTYFVAHFSSIIKMMVETVLSSRYWTLCAEWCVFNSMLTMVCVECCMRIGVCMCRTCVHCSLLIELWRNSVWL